MKLNDQITVHHIEIDLAAKTPKQDDDEEHYDPDKQRPDVTITTTPNQPETTSPTDDFAKMQSLLNSLASNHYQHDDERLKMIQLISRHLEPVLAGDAPSVILTRFTRRHHPNSVNQVCPNGDSQIIQDQLSNQDIQKMVRILTNNEPLPSHVNFTSSFFQKLVKNRKRLEVVNKVLYRNFFDNTGRFLLKQIVVPPETTMPIIRTMHGDPMQGHPGASKMLVELRKRYYIPNASEHESKYVSNCIECIRAKPVNPKRLTPPLEKIYDPCNGPEDVLEIDLVGELPNSNGYTHILTACDYFLRYLFTVPIRKPDAKSVVKALMQIFTQHAYVPKTIITDKGTAFTSSIMTEIMKTAGIKIDHATVKHAQTIGMVERSHQKLKQILKINVSADSPQWDRYVNIAVMAHNTTYHNSLKCTPSEVFHGRLPFNALDLKFDNPLKCETTETDITRLVDQVNEKSRQVNDNILQAYHKYKRYYDRKAQALPLKVNDFTFLLNPKLTTQSDEISFNDFKWEGLFKVIKVLTNFNHIIRKVGTFRTQCVRRMRLRPFTPNARKPDIEEDSNRLFADPDAADDQALFNDHMPQHLYAEPAPETTDQEEIDNEHGIIYYEYVRKSDDQTLLQPIPENPP